MAKDDEMDDDEDQGRSNVNLENLSKAKRKQIFKKNQAKQIKAQIADLKLQSKKLKKSNSAQKAEKKKIAKMIKELKAQVKRSGEDKGDGDDSDESSE